MLVETLQLGPLPTNCYIYSPDGERGVVIDPAADARFIAGHLRALDLKAVAIINTHGHLDHIGGNAGLRALLDCPLLIGAPDAPYLGPNAEAVHRQDALLVGPEAVALFQTSYVASPPADVLLHDGDVTPGGLRVLATPGHTAGGVSLVADGVVFVGDTLFEGSVGRWDLCGGDEATLLHAIKTKLLPLPRATTVYPGHGPKTTIGAEKSHNPYLT